MSAIGINTSDYEPSTGGGRTIYPAGQYLMVITGDIFKTTKNGKGEGFLFDFQIIEGDHQGAELKNWVTYAHQSQVAEQIGRGELRAIADAVGIQNPADTSQLYNIPMLVTLGVEYKRDPATGEDVPDGNQFKKIEAANNQAPPQQQAPQQQYQQAPAQQEAPAWQR